MSKIRAVSVGGKFERYVFEMHYSAKEKCFLAKKLPDELQSMIGEHTSIAGPSENSVESAIRKLISEYEETFNNWKLYLFYEFSGKVFPETLLNSRSGWDRTRVAFTFDFDAVYYVNVSGEEYYIRKEDWDRGRKNPQKVKYSSYQYSSDNERYTRGRIEYTTELEGFFESIVQASDSLINKLTTLLSNQEQIVLSANNPFLLK